MLTSLLVAGAIAFCAGQPAEPRCTDVPVTVATITDAHRATFAEIAPAIRLGSRYRAEGLDDAWAPSRTGDCEDALLWAAHELRLRHPELRNAYRFVLIHQGWERRGTQRVRLTHLVLVVEGTDGRIVLDTQYREPRAWSDYAANPAFTAAGSIAGQWRPY